MDEPESLRSILNRMIRDTELGGVLDRARVWGQWTRIAGEDLAACTAPAALEDGLLIVHVTDSSWMEHCLYEKWEIIRRINREAGRQVVSDIRFELVPDGMEPGQSARKLRRRRPGSGRRGKKDD